MSQSRSWRSLNRQRIPRRALLRAGATAGVGMTGLALVGCGGDDDDDDTEEAAPQVAAPADEQEEEAEQQAAQQAAEQALEQEGPQAEEPEVVEEQEQAQAVGPLQGGVLRWGTNLAVHDTTRPAPEARPWPHLTYFVLGDLQRVAILGHNRP